MTFCCWSRSRIHTIDLWIRISILLRIVLFTLVTFKFFCFFKVHLHHFSKIKSHQEFAKQYLGITVFLTILLDDRRIRILYLWLMDLKNILILWIRIQIRIRNTGSTNTCLHWECRSGSKGLRKYSFCQNIWILSRDPVLLKYVYSFTQINQSC